MELSLTESCKDCPNAEILDSWADGVDEGTISCRGLTRSTGRGGSPLLYCAINKPDNPDIVLPDLLGMRSSNTEGATRVIAQYELTRLRPE